MKPLTKLTVWSAGYCAVLAALNWFYRVERVRADGSDKWSIHAVGLAYVISVGVVLWLVWSGGRMAKGLLESGGRVQPDTWIGRRWVIVFALPLLWERHCAGTSVNADGSTVTVSWGYGHDGSGWLFFWTVAGLLLFQVYLRLLGGDVGRHSG